MDSNQNPYSAPKTTGIANSSVLVDTSSYYVEGKRLVIRDDAQLPNLCIYNGEETSNNKRTSVTLYWISPWWAILIPLGFVPYLIAYICVRKKCTVHYSLSFAGRRNRAGIIALIFFTLIGFIFGTFYFSSKNDILSTGCLVAMLISAGSIFIYTAHFRPKKYKDGWLIVSGPSKKFLARISEKSES